MYLPAEKRKEIILGVDVGTTNIKCYAYDRFANILGKADDKLDVFNPGDGRVEIIPDVLWRNFKKVVNNCLMSSHLHANEVTCMGISTQRGTFLTWDRETGQPYHNFISWKDRRTDGICEKWNSYVLLKLLKFFCFLLYTFTRIVKFQVLSSFEFSSSMVLMRLYWVLEHFPEIRHKAKQDEILFGTIDSWLVWKLTEGKVHATDCSNACVTGFFDPFTMTWIDCILKYFNIPKNILPVVKNTCDSFGETVPGIFGSSIPICCLVGDQQASTFGACCFEKDEINCTMGTGSFLSINTGDKPSTSYSGIFPLVGWTIHSKATYVIECGFHETGPYVTWLQNLGFLKNLSDSSILAKSVSDNHGVYFLPAHSLLTPTLDGVTGSQFVGLRPYSSKEHIVRSVLESLAFQICLLFKTVCKLYRKHSKINAIRICGGVAKNDFVVQVISDVTEKPVHRLKHGDTSSVGAAFLAGLHYGIWKSLEEITELQTEYDAFYPSYSQEKTLNSFRNWARVLKHL